MPFEVGTKDCTALSDAELAEMADLCVDRAPGFDIGFLSKQCEEWVLVTLVREGNKLRGLLLLHPGAHRRDAVAAGRAGHRRPHGQGRAGHAAAPRRPVPPGGAGLPRRGRPGGHPLASCRGASRPSPAWPTWCPGPGHKATGEERAWGRRLAKRFGAEGRIDDRTFILAGDGSTAGALDLGGPKVKVPADEVAAAVRGPEPQARRPPGRLRVGHGRGPGLGSPGRRQGRARADAPPSSRRGLDLRVGAAAPPPSCSSGRRAAG